jgi:sugar phosphate isomerase/epimerase
MKLPISLELYTLRNETSTDFMGTLEKVAQMGYKGVEFAGFGDIPADKMNEALIRLGLEATGSHTGKDELADNLDKVIEYNLEIGNKYVVLPYDKQNTKAEWLEEIRKYSLIGKKLKKNGLQFCYHNHAHEFVKYDGEYIFDTIYKNTDKDILKAEIDTYWVYHAGLSPVEYIRKYSNRCPLLHLKDMRPGDRDTAEVGEGIMDIGAIIKAAEETGVKWLIVEQDNCLRPPLESVKISIGNLMNKY